MGCLLTQTLTRDCDFVLGGISRLWIGDRANLISASSSSITMSSATYMTEVEFAPDTANFINELVISNGQRYVNQGISFSIDSKADNILAAAPELALGKFFAVAEDKSLDKYLLGRKGYGLQATVVSLNSGTAVGDFGGLVVTMTNGSTEYAIKYTGTVPVA